MNLLFEVFIRSMRAQLNELFNEHLPTYFFEECFGDLICDQFKVRPFSAFVESGKPLHDCERDVSTGNPILYHGSKSAESLIREAREHPDQVLNPSFEGAGYIYYHGAAVYLGNRQIARRHGKSADPKGIKVTINFVTEAKILYVDSFDKYHLHVRITKRFAEKIVKPFFDQNRGFSELLRHNSSTEEDITPIHLANECIKRCAEAVGIRAVLILNFYDTTDGMAFISYVGSKKEGERGPRQIYTDSLGSNQLVVHTDELVSL